jgi:hypothetical protein
MVLFGDWMISIWGRKKKFVGKSFQNRSFPEAGKDIAP